MPKQTKPFIQLNPTEQEAVTLKAVWDMIDGMVNYEMMVVYPESNILFESMSHRAYFYVLFSDFLSAPVEFFSEKRTYADRLCYIVDSPTLGSSHGAKPLKTIIEKFNTWLTEVVVIQNRWFPSLDLEIDLTVSRKEMFLLGGNITKHNITQLTRQAKLLKNIMEKQGYTISHGQSLLAIRDAYEQFNQDLFLYYANQLAEFLNEIRWGIYDYCAPIRTSCTINSYCEDLKMPWYKYIYPKGLEDEFAQSCFWELMNNVRNVPYMPRFSVADAFKKHDMIRPC